MSDFDLEAFGGGERSATTSDDVDDVIADLEDTLDNVMRRTRWIISPNELYQDGFPRTGAKIDRKAHLARFPKNEYVLTTGGTSTHVYTGRAIMLGPSPASRRTLAHEFLHLLGFTDTYVRSHKEDPKGPFGVVFVEWSGLTDDLMSSPGHGRVSDAMIETLIETYSKRPPDRTTGR